MQSMIMTNGSQMMEYSCSFNFAKFGRYPWFFKLSPRYLWKYLNSVVRALTNSFNAKYMWTLDIEDSIQFTLNKIELNDLQKFQIILRIKNTGPYTISLKCKAKYNSINDLFNTWYVHFTFVNLHGWVECK